MGSVFRVLGFRVWGLKCSASGVEGFDFIWGVGVGFRFRDCYKDPPYTHTTLHPQAVVCGVSGSAFRVCLSDLNHITRTLQVPSNRGI